MSQRTRVPAGYQDREDLGADGVYQRYWLQEGLPKVDALEALKLIEFEYSIPAGLLRPDDEVGALVEAPTGHNPLRGISHQVTVGDKEFELAYQLRRRLRRFGTASLWAGIRTVDEFVRAWCGARPR